ncbi:hypothetical protein Taro_037373 [Colocasia esculenta]|uniref:Uncharacterized protein n=1 Tax=Colocasia esculenta TaxID=4460 RepID=A0A843W409_COLES|nr:hypothetical protein [Colocasia esculenta]
MIGSTRVQVRSTRVQIKSNLSYQTKAQFSQLLHIVSVSCHAPQVHTPAVNKYVGVLLPRTRQGPIAQALYQVLDRSPTMCRTNIFILWPQSFNDKLIVKRT